MRLRGGVGWGAAAHLLSLSGLPRRGAVTALRRGGLATAVGLAAVRSPNRAVIVREHDTMTGRELDAAVAATASALAGRWPAGTRIGVRGDGGIDFVAVLAAAALAGLDAVAIGPRSAGIPELETVASWDVFVREGSGGPRTSRRGRVLLLSSGTTGEPTVTARGRLGPRGMLQLVDADRRVRMPDGAVLVLAPPDHGHGLSTAAAALMRGRTVVLASGMRPAEQAEASARHRVTTISGVPAQLGRLLEADPSVLRGVRLVMSGSSRLPSALRERLAADGARVVDCYGSTETGTVAIDGRPLAGVTIDVDAGGRILITSPLSGGTRDPGDVGHVDSGRLVVDGRHGDVVDSGGELVAPERVAEKLRAMPGIVAARVWVEDDDLLGSVLCAEVDAPGVDLASLIAGLPRAERPRRFVARE